MCKHLIFLSISCIDYITFYWRNQVSTILVAHCLKSKGHVEDK